MRVSAVLTVFFFGFGAITVAQNTSQYQPVPVQPSQRVVIQNGGPVPVYVQGQQPGQGGGQRQPGMGMPGGPGGGQPGGAPPWMQGSNQQGGRPGQQPGGPQVRPGTAQGNQPGGARGGGQQPQPGGMNANQVTQAIGRLRALDTSGTGVLNLNSVPANQQARVTAIIQQLGGNPNGPINIAQLERRAMAANNAQQSNQPADNTGRQQRRQTGEPLVRPFGEQAAANTPVLEFGQRDAASQTAQGGRGQQGRQQRDIAAAQAQQAAAQATRNANTVRQSATYDSIPQTVRNNPAFSWFFEYDTDKDGQLTMLEYRNGRGGTWTDELAEEFSRLDRNGDGFVTVDEALTTIVEWDREREQQEREQQVAGGPQQQGRQQPGQQMAGRPTPTGTPANQNVRSNNPNGQNQGNPRQQATGNQGGNAQGRGNQQGGRGGGPGGGGNFGGNRGGRGGGG